MIPPIKIMGGKFFLRKDIIKLFPLNYQNLNYAELFCGSGSVFFLKDRCASDWLNDIDVGIFNLFVAIRDEPETLINALQNIQCNKETFLKYKNLTTDDKIQIAVKEFVMKRMSLRSLGECFSNTFRLRGGQNELVNSWQNAVKRIPTCSQKLKDVKITNFDFREIFPHDENVLCYLDPPYLLPTVSRKLYKHVLSNEDHIDLLYLCNKSKSKIILSGYQSELYNKYLCNWNLKIVNVANHASARPKKKRIDECLWYNF